MAGPIWTEEDEAAQAEVDAYAEQAAINALLRPKPAGAAHAAAAAPRIPQAVDLGAPPEGWSPGVPVGPPSPPAGPRTILRGDPAGFVHSGPGTVEAGPAPSPATPGKVSRAQQLRAQAQQLRDVAGLKMGIEGAAPSVQAAHQEAMKHQERQATEELLSQFSSARGGGSRSTSTQTVSPELGPEAAARLGMDNADILGNAREAYLMRSQISAELKRQTKTRIGQAEGEQRGARMELAKASRSFDRARRTVDAWRGPDPGRYWREMGNTRRALNVIAVALGGFVEGFTYGKVRNRAAEMLERAIDRDIAAQKDRHAANLQRLGLAQDERNRAQLLYDRYSDRLRGLMRSMTQVKLGEVAAKEQFGQARRSYLQIAHRLEAASTPKTVKTERRGYTSGGMSPRDRAQLMLLGAKLKGAGAGAQGRQIPRQAKMDLQEGEETMAQVKALMTGVTKQVGAGVLGYGKMAWNRAKAALPLVGSATDPAVTRAQADALALRLSAAWNRGRPTDRDTALIKPLIPDPTRDTAESAAKKYSLLKRMHRHRMSLAQKYWPGDVYDVRALRKAEEGSRK